MNMKIIFVLFAMIMMTYATSESYIEEDSSSNDYETDFIITISCIIFLVIVMIILVVILLVVALVKKAKLGKKESSYTTKLNADEEF